MYAPPTGGDKLGKLEGKLNSPSEASGETGVVPEFGGCGFRDSIVCDMGTWDWSAKSR